MEDLFFPDIKGLIIIPWISPAINLLSLTFTVIASAKSETFREQVNGFLVISVIFVLVAQMTDVLLLSNLVMFIVGGVLLILGYILIKRISFKFISEKLI